MWYEVDLRSRKTGDSVECIYSGDDYEKAYEVMNKWNEVNLTNYDGRAWDDYIDGSDGLFAYVYHIEDKDFAHGVGMMVNF